MLTVTRRLEIDAGHRLLGHEGKCRNVHGHRYVFEITCAAPERGLDDVGRVIDFSVIKAEVGGWLDEQWDHGFVAQTGDPILAWLYANGMKTYAMKSPPTAENMATLLFDKAVELMDKHSIQVTQVRVHETPNCVATYPA